MDQNRSIEINWRPQHYVSRFWLDKSDPYMSELRFMTIGFPIYWILLVFFLTYTIKRIVPSILEDRKPVDVRPIMLIMDGLAFGGYITALVTSMVPTNFYSDCFDCAAYSATSQRMDHIVMKHFAYGVVFAKLFDFLIPLLQSLSKKPVSNLHLLYLMGVTLGTVTLVKINPGGIFIFAALVDGMHSAILYSYLTFTAADPKLRPSSAWKSAVFFSKMLCWSLILAHSAYFLSMPNCGEPIIKLALMGLSILVLCFYPYDFYRTQLGQVNSKVDKSFEHEKPEKCSRTVSATVLSDWLDNRKC